MRDLVGTWRLVRATSVGHDGCELPQPYGGRGMGVVVLGADGRMAAVLCDARRDLPDGESREYSSYCGNYTFDGEKLVTRVDAALSPERIGSDQVREVRFEGELMVLRPPARSYGGVVEQRELYWRKVSES